MNITDFQDVQSSNYNLLVSQVKQNAKVNVIEVLKQLDPREHDVMKVSKRPNKMVTVNDPENETIEIKKRVEVARLPLPFQKLITSRAAAFLCGNPITYEHGVLNPLESDFYDIFTKVIDDNKIDYKNIDIAYKMMGETEAAEIWYTEKVADKDPDYWAGTAAEGAAYRLRVKIVANSLGDRLCPVYDIYGDMIAFGRGYEITEGNLKFEHFDIYTATQVFKGRKTNLSGDWIVTVEPNMMNKIPVIYYSQSLPEWSDVQPLIGRLEVCGSNNADTNDYFGSPIIVANGNVRGFSSKGETGKVLEISGGTGKVDYLTWDNAPENAKNEIEWLTKMIYNMTDTPNISLEEMKDVNTFSGVAIKMLFLSAHMKAATKEGVFGECVTRRINFLKKALSVIEPKFESVAKMKIKPKFKYFMPDNTAEMIDILSTAVGAEPIMSQKTAASINPLVTDAGSEFKQMQDEGKIGPAVSLP